MRKLILSGAVLWIATLATFAAQTPQRTSDARPAVTNPSTSPGTGRLAADDAALIKQYCVGCHNDRTKLGGLTLQSVDVASVGAHAEVLEKAIRKVKTGMMPPSGSPRPDRATLDAFAA
jgi:cytochrome c551/c552